MVDFTKEYARFLQYHEGRRSGERLRRLQNGHGHAEQRFLEQIWWPVFHSFTGLHPEYEVLDYKDGYRYLDFAYIQPMFRVAMEIDGYGPHLREVSRWQFADHIRRQNQLVIDGWYVLRFSYDDINEHPRLCQQAVQQLLGRIVGLLSPEMSHTLKSPDEREIIKLAVRATTPITPVGVAELLDVSRHTAYRLLTRLTQERWLEPAKGKVRIRSYRIHPSRRHIRL